MVALVCLQPALRRRPSVWTALGVVGLVCLFGAFMEFLQKLDHRDADPIDALANAIGAGAIFLYWLVLRSVFERRLRRSAQREREGTPAAAADQLRANAGSSSATTPAIGRPTPT